MKCTSLGLPIQKPASEHHWQLHSWQALGQSRLLPHHPPRLDAVAFWYPYIGGRDRSESHGCVIRGEYSWECSGAHIAQARRLLAGGSTKNFLLGPSKRAADCGTPARGGKHFGRVKSSELGGHDSTAADIAMASCSLPQLRAPTPLLGAVPTASRRPRRAVGRPTRALKDKHESATPPRRTRNLHIVDGKLPLFVPSVFRRRFVVGTLAGSLIALGADFLGSTSALLSLNPDYFRGLRADVLYPIGGYKRCLESSQGFEFVFPQEWVGDQTLLYRAVQRGERERSLDLPVLRQQSNRKPRPTEPVLAFGPPGTLGELNVSVVVAPVADGFTLEKLGDSTEAGTTILKRSIAPEGSNKVATLLKAARRDERGTVYYTLEYTVQGPAFFRHNVAVYAVSAGDVFTLNAQAPQSLWPSVHDQFRVISSSFRLIDVPTP